MITLEEKLNQEVKARGLKVIKSAKEFNIDLLDKVTMVVGISLDDELCAYKTKRWNAKATLFVLCDNYLLSEHCIKTIGDTLFLLGKQVQVKNSNTIRIL
jgi:hypothetical protein